MESCHLTRHIWYVTVQASPATLAEAAVCGTSLHALASVLAGRATTQVHQGLTVVARVARGTGAAVTAQPIDAGATVLTRFGVTLIDVELAIGTSEARLAMANV